MSKYTIKTATAIYTGGGIYIYYGELENGLYFRTADEWQSISICNADTSTEDADYLEFFDEYQVDELMGLDYQRFFNDMISWINDNNPQGNYNMEELKRRMIKVLPKPRATRNKIEELEKELLRLKRIEQLETFLNHMSDTFETHMGNDCTDETCTTFYNMAFTVSFNGKSIILENSAETFQSIESIIEQELEYLSE